MPDGCTIGASATAEPERMGASSVPPLRCAAMCGGVLIDATPLSPPSL
ncbi:hypothetical protein [Corynebacterium faecale]